MKRQIKHTIWFLALLALVSAPHLASAYYDPGVQRWINRDPINEPGFELLHGLAVRDVVSNLRHSTKYLAIPNLYGYVANRPPGRLDVLGLYIIEILEPAESAGGNTLNCGLVSETSPIQGDPTQGPDNRNGQSVCIWRCSYYGDEPPKQAPITVLTFTPPNKPCPLPKDCNGKPAHPVGYQHNPILNPPNPYE